MKKDNLVFTENTNPLKRFQCSGNRILVKNSQGQQCLSYLRVKKDSVDVTVVGVEKCGGTGRQVTMNFFSRAAF